MNCPHCLTEFHDTRNFIPLGEDKEGGWVILKYNCPNPDCLKDIYYLINGKIIGTPNGMMIEDSNIKSKVLIRPRGINRRPLSKEIPENLTIDYVESCLVLDISPKASAALSRRCLQNILREKADIKKGDLSSEIQQVIDSLVLPSHLSECIDAVRNVGNFAAHPIKSKSTGEIIEVEFGEAEWNLDVIENLFDFYFVQPAKTKAKKDALNEKLKAAGKNLMK